MNLTLVPVIIKAAKAANVSVSLLLSICFVESSFHNVVTPHDGNSASIGVCQVKLNTAKMFNPKANPSHLLIPSENARYAALYLAFQLRRYNGSVSHAVAAYNKGTARCKNAPDRFDISDISCDTRYVRKVFLARENKPWIVHSKHKPRQLAQMKYLSLTEEQ